MRRYVTVLAPDGSVVGVDALDLAADPLGRILGSTVEEVVGMWSVRLVAVEADESWGFTFDLPRPHWQVTRFESAREAPLGLVPVNSWAWSSDEDVVEVLAGGAFVDLMAVRIASVAGWRVGAAMARRLVKTGVAIPST